MESREQKRPLPGFGQNLDERESTEPGGAREDRVRLLNEITSEGLKILKQSERHLPDSVERLSPSTRKQLNDLMQVSYADYKSYWVYEEIAEITRASILFADTLHGAKPYAIIKLQKHIQN